MSKQATLAELDETNTPDLPKAKYVNVKLPPGKFYEGVRCREFADGSKSFELSDYRVLVCTSGMGYTFVFISGHGENRSCHQRTFELVNSMAATEAAVLYLRLLIRGELQSALGRAKR